MYKQERFRIFSNSDLDQLNGVAALNNKYSGRRYSIGQNFNPKAY
jgi:hypothetical protein